MIANNFIIEVTPLSENTQALYLPEITAHSQTMFLLLPKYLPFCGKEYYTYE